MESLPGMTSTPRGSRTATPAGFILLTDSTITMWAHYAAALWIEQ